MTEMERSGNMKKYVLTISELAKLRNTTSETLRHYDRIGLLKPVYVSDGGHRYYSIRQYEKLGTILELKEMGMSLEEIKEYFENRNLRKSYEMLKTYQQRFEERLKEQIRLNEIMREKLEFVRSLFSLPEMETIFEEEFPLRHMITLGRESGDRGRARHGLYEAGREPGREDPDSCDGPDGRIFGSENPDSKRRDDSGCSDGTGGFGKRRKQVRPGNPGGKVCLHDVQKWSS